MGAKNGPCAQGGDSGKGIFTQPHSAFQSLLGPQGHTQALWQQNGGWEGRATVLPGEHPQGEKETKGEELAFKNQRESSSSSSLHLHASLTLVHFSFCTHLVVSLPPR